MDEEIEIAEFLAACGEAVELEQFAEMQQVSSSSSSCQYYNISDADSYSAAMSACEKGEQWQGTDVISYSAAMSACEKGEISACERDHQVEKDLRSRLFAALSRQLELQSALEVSELKVAFFEEKILGLIGFPAVTEAENARISACEKEPKGITCTALISAGEKGHEAESAIEGACACEKGNCQSGLTSELGKWAEAETKGSKGDEVKRVELQQRGVLNEVGRTIELDAEMQQRGFAHTALISACEKGQVKKALELFTGMLQNGLTPDVIAYNSLISACEKGQKIDKAMELLAEMKGRGVEPNVTTYTVLISACVKGHEVEEILALFRDAHGCSKDIQAGDHYMQAIVARTSNAREGQNMQLALKLYFEMKKLQLNLQYGLR